MIALGFVGLTAVAFRAARRVAPRERVRVLGPRSALRLPDVLVGWVDEALHRAGLLIDPVEALRWWSSIAAAAGLVGVAIRPLVGATLAGLVIVAGPIFVLSRRDRGARAVRAALPGLLDDVASELRSGGTLRSGLDRAAERGDLLGHELRPLAIRVQLGIPLADALSMWADETRGGVASDVRVVAGVLGVAVATGGRAAMALEGAAAGLRDRLAIADEARAQSAQGRLSAMVVGALPLAALASSVVFDGAATRVLIANPIGRMAGICGVLCELGGVWWIRRIVRADS